MLITGRRLGQAWTHFSLHLFHNLHLLERPDLIDPAIDFEGFRERVRVGLLKQL
jgi:hypothetical protein